MNKLNKFLLTIFLTTGIIFFAVFLYMFFSKEILKKEKHSVNLKEVRVIYNSFANQTVQEKNENPEEYKKDEPSYYTHKFSLVNASDNLSYTKSIPFNLLKDNAPFGLRFDDTYLPMEKDDYTLVIQKSNEEIEKFPTMKLSEVLKLNKKTDSTSEIREIKLESKNKKLIVYLIFRLNYLF